MLKVPFEQFLSKLLCQYLDNTLTNDSKYHFVCSDPEQATRLYNGFGRYANGFDTIKVDGINVPYINTPNGHRIIIMLHRNGEQSMDTYHEDFIAKVRDALNDIENASLVVIHNSALETILTSCKSLSSEGCVFTPKYVKTQLLDIANEHPHALIADVLIENKEQQIKDENRSVFGYQSLYNSLKENIIDFQAEKLFIDERLFDNKNKREIKGDIKENTKLFCQVSQLVNDFSDSEKELKDKLEELGLGEKFVNENFTGKKAANWKSLDYRVISSEIEENKNRKLDLTAVEFNNKLLETWKRSAISGAKYKHITVVIEADVGNVDLKFRMTKGDPLLKPEQIKVNGDCNPHQLSISASNYEKQTVLSAGFIFDGNPKFVQIKLSRPSNKENFQFNCLVVKKSTFNLANYFEKVTVEFRRTKGVLLLENAVDSIQLNDEITNEHVIKKSGEVIDCENVGRINLKRLLETEVSAELTFKYNTSLLPVNVTGAVTLDSVKLPSILDPQRSSYIFDADRIPKYSPKTKRAIVAGKEKELSVDAKTLCSIERVFIENNLLFLDEINEHQTAANDIEIEYSEISKAYKTLYAWLDENETILSLTNWPQILRELVTELLTVIDHALDNIPEGSLNEAHKKLLSIGIYKGNINKENSEWLTPYHPLCLAYSLQLAETLSVSMSGKLNGIPQATIDKLNPAGLLPILFHHEHNYAFTTVNSHNKTWLQIVPQKQNNQAFVTKLVHEKINDFTTCFEMLFRQNKNAPLLINSIHNQTNKYLFKGVVSYIKKNKSKAKPIHINLYDDELFNTYFDRFSESKDIEFIRTLVQLVGNEKPAVTDELIALVRNKVTYSKFVKENEYSYAHLSFFKNNEKVLLKDKKVTSAKTGIACQGLIAGEASYLENNNYYTGFGLQNLQDENLLISLASKYNQLFKPLKDKSAPYIKGVVPVLSVQDGFKEKLKNSYKSSIWTCVIDPKVTLDFFDDKDTILIHYSDQYTNSIAYDAITVSSRIGLYKGLLNEDTDELLNSFNAVSGQWLLDIVKSAGKPKKSNTEKQVKEKQGIVAGYKFVSSLLLKSDIDWVPISVAEMLRVTGNVGLEIKEGDFSARLHNKRKGAMSDDILFVGFKKNAMYLLPLEVKTREKGTDFTKAIEQAKELAEHMKRLLAPLTFKGQVYRALFIQHVMSQIERYQLYKIFPKNYFDKIIAQRELLQQGTYQINNLRGYPQGIALAINSNKESSRIECNPDISTAILKLQVPHGLMQTLQSQTVEKLSEKLTCAEKYPEINEYVLVKSVGEPVCVEELNEEVGDNVEQGDDLLIQGSNESTREVKLNSFSINFEFPSEFCELVEKLLNSLGRDLNIEDVIALTENDFKCLVGDSEQDILYFYRLKEVLTHNNTDKGFFEVPVQTSPQVNIEGGEVKLKDLNITQEFFALSNFIKRCFGEDINVGKVLTLSDEKLLQQNRFGKKKLVKFHEFKKLICENYFSEKCNDKSSILIENYDISLSDLEQHLIYSLDMFLKTAGEREKDIFVRRFGIGCESSTLEDIGKDYHITRERIRQIEKKAKGNFLARLTVAQKVIQVITKSNLSELREPLFKTLRSYFLQDKHFYSFLELCCGLKENEIRHITTPDIHRDYFNEFWLANKSPANLEDITWYLHETLNVEVAVAENQILRWKEQELLLLDDEVVSPVKLPKVEAVTNTLLEFPNGATWENIQRRVIEKEITIADITTERLEPSLMTAVDRELIYQSARGTYCHLSYLSLLDSEIELIVNCVKNKLEEYKLASRDSVNLAVDIYQQQKFSQDYFTIRHVVRTYGSTVGIYFNGKSGADTVSLNSEFSLASQKTVLSDLFKNSLTPLSKNDVANKIRSKSLAHAAFYMDKLLTEGVVVRVGEIKFAHVDNAFKDVDIDCIMNLLIEFINNEDRVIEGESFQMHINRKLSLEYNKYFYLSLLKAYAENYGLKLYFVQNLVSKSPINHTGLADFCREALLQVTNNNKALNLVKQTVCAHDHVIKRCLHQVGNASSLSEGVNEANPVVGRGGGGIFDNNKHQLDGHEVKLSTGKEYAQKSNSIEDCRVLIGRTLDTSEKLYWEYGNEQLANRHLIVFGRSGQGKTYCIQGLLMEMAKAQCNSLVIDYTNGFLPNHLEEEFLQYVRPNSHFLAQKPLSISPFRKQKQDFGGVILEEQDHVVAARISSVFNQVYSSIGEQQLATLSNVLEAGIQRYGADYDFECMLDDLREESKTGEILANKLSPMVKSRLFDNTLENGWNHIFTDNKSRTNIVQLASLSRDIMRLATEFTLWDLYAYACNYGEKTKPLPIVLDEVQNLDHGLESPLGKMLTEGRKYGISLILATQTLSMLAKEEQDRLFQASHKLFFAPAETEIQSYAKLLEQAVPGTNRKIWLEELAKLKKGECISVGLHLDENANIVQGAKTVRVSALKDRLQ